MKKEDKRAVSMVITSIIIILVSISIFVGAASIITQEIKERSKDVEKKMYGISNINLEIINVYIDGENLKIIIQNTGNQEISSFIVRVKGYNLGKEELYIDDSVYLSGKQKLGPLNTKDILIIPAPFGKNIKNYISVEVYPKFEFQGKEEIAETAKDEIYEIKTKNLDNEDSGGQEEPEEPKKEINTEIRELQEKFDNYLLIKYPSGIIEINSIYYIEPFLAGFISMYEATQDDSYIEYALKNTEYQILKMRDIDGDSYLEWPATESSVGIDHDSNLSTPNRLSCLDNSRGTRQFARLARIIKNDNHLNSVYGKRADNIIFVLKREIINDPYCKSNFIKGSNSYDRLSDIVLILLELYHIEGNQKFIENNIARWSNGQYYNLTQSGFNINVSYLDSINYYSNALKKGIFKRENPKILFWGTRTTCTSLNETYPHCYYLAEEVSCNDSNGTTFCSPFDISHSEKFVFGVIESYRSGIVFTRGDIDNFIYTFTNVIWNKNTTRPGFYDFIDGHLSPSNAAYLPWKMGSNLAPGWIGLGAFNKELHETFKKGEYMTTGRIPNYPNQAYWLNPLAYYGELARNSIAGECKYTNSAKEICDSKDNDCDSRIDENLNC